MARAYTVGTVALALQLPVKWIDNVLSHHPVSGVSQARQGVARRVSIEGLLNLALAALLIRELDIPTARAVDLASALSQADGRYLTPGGIALRIDLPSIQAELLTRLAQAVEIAPVPRRGRPLADSRTGRLD